MIKTSIRWLLRAAPVGLSMAAAAQAQQAPKPLAPGHGKLLLTGGVSSIDGAAGGGLTPWAVIGSYADRGEFGATAFLTRTRTRDYGLTAYGAAIGIDDRVELSLAQQRFDADAVVPGTTLKLDIVGIKLKVAGDAVLDADTWMPQVAVGAQYKRLSPGNIVGGVLDSVGAVSHGIDLYASATKLFLAQGLLVDGTLRATEANQNGLLGFGSAATSGYRVRPEISVAWLARRNVAIGAEYRWKPNQLAFAGAAFREQAWKDLFVAWAPGKNVSITLAWVDLGNIVGQDHQTGAYLSVQLGH